MDSYGVRFKVRDLSLETTAKRATEVMKELGLTMKNAAEAMMVLAEIMSKTDAELSCWGLQDRRQFLSLKFWKKRYWYSEYQYFRYLSRIQEVQKVVVKTTGIIRMFDSEVQGGSTESEIAATDLIEELKIEAEKATLYHSYKDLLEKGYSHDDCEKIVKEVFESYEDEHRESFLWILNTIAEDRGMNESFKSLKRLAKVRVEGLNKENLEANLPQLTDEVWHRR